MSIRRQYSLPNCTLVLDGLSDGSSTSGIADPRPIMSSLYNAECHFVGCEQPLLGGRDFLTSLVTTVSNYAQAFLSGISHPLSEPAPSLVSLVKGDRDNIHQLQATLDPTNDRPNSADATTAAQPTRVNLTTVQLFDLLEAIDQFLADKRTLPDIMIPLQPISKAIAQPMATQAVPIGLGVASLLAASLIGYALPSPKVTPPAAPRPTATTTPATPTTPATTPQPPATTTPAPSSAVPSKTGTLTSATQLGFLERKLQRDLRQDWQQRDRPQQPASFQVNVNQDGQIVGYQPVGTTNAAQSKLTPLAKLAIANPNPNQAIGNFNVVFNPTGAIDITSTTPVAGADFGKPISDAKLQTTLATQLKSKLQQSLASTKPIDSQNLNYRVAVTTTGDIADYAPDDRRAYENETKTPLPKLAKFNSQAAISQEPLAQYKVTFQPDGKIMVAPK